jgi:hypothetical protein
MIEPHRHGKMVWLAEFVERNMTIVRAEVTDRRLEIAVPADWPDGTLVEVSPVQRADDGDKLTPEEIAATLAAMDRSEPLEMSEEEILAWEAQRRSRIEREKAEFMKRAEALRSNWE